MLLENRYDIIIKRGTEILLIRYTWRLGMGAKWIWQNVNNNSDEYVKFVDEFSLEQTNALLTISCDSNYNAYLNGELVAFGQYADYPHFKVCDKIDLSAYTKQGKNLLVIVVWYHGENTQCYTRGNAGLYYKVESASKLVAYSSEKTQCAIAQDFVCYQKRFITVQLGLSYCYDSRYYDGYDRILAQHPLHPLKNSCVYLAVIPGP